MILSFSSFRAEAGVIYSGVAAGDVTTNSAILWTRTADTIPSQGIVSNLTAQLSSDPFFSTINQSFSGATNSSHDYTLKINAVGLNSGTEYYYRFLTNQNEISPVGRFKTAPEAAVQAPVRFGFSGDADGKWRPYGSTANFNNLNLDYFVFLGDTIYESASTGSPATTSLSNPTQPKIDQALLDYYRKYRENLEPVATGSFSSLENLFTSQGNYTLLDNHELGNQQLINGGAPAANALGLGVDPVNPANDVNSTGKYINQTSAFKALVQAYSDYQPIQEKILSAPGDARSNGTQQLFFAQQWGANSIFINVDDRSYRDIRLKTALGADDTGSRADNPNRTLLGSTQLAWLKQTLLAAQNQGTPWKIIAISSPIDEGGEDSGKSWIGGYRAERNDLLKFIADNHINNVLFLSTDDHQNRINELTYFTNPNDPSTRTIVPNTFTIVAGPLGAGGPDGITDHSFSNIQSLANAVVTKQLAQGFNPLGLGSGFLGLSQVYREGDPTASSSPKPVDFFTPDTFNYVTLDISADGKNLSVNTYGINSYAANTFPQPQSSNAVRRVLGFQLTASVIPESSPTVGILMVGLFGILGIFKRNG